MLVEVYRKGNETKSSNWPSRTGALQGLRTGMSVAFIGMDQNRIANTGRANRSWPTRNSIPNSICAGTGRDYIRFPIAPSHCAIASANTSTNAKKIIRETKRAPGFNSPTNQGQPLMRALLAGCDQKQRDIN